MLDVRVATEDDVDGCVDVLAALPGYFTRDTHDDLRQRFPTCEVWVAARANHVMGCVLLQPRYRHSAEICYAAVRPEEQRSGIGRQLIAHLVDAAPHLVIEVKTLDASSDYEPYVGTRAFWEAMGFVQIDCIDPLPGWRPGNPSAIYVCALRPTRPI